MKKTLIFLMGMLLALALVGPQVLADKKRVDVDGDTIKFMDADLDTLIYQDGSGLAAPRIYRVCIDGLEFLIVNDKGDITCVQVKDRNGYPKTCRR